MVLSAPTAKRLFDSNPLHHDTYLLTLPLFHSSGQTVTMNAGLSVGATLVLMPRFEAEAALDPMLAEPVTVFAGGLKFATTVGIHSCNIGVPILMEKVERRCGTGG
jgi:acyl-CoA synthetase (AMP-forming)/AMP-acid ligase II